MSARTCLCLAAICGCLAVFLGAFGAHGLKDSGFLERKYADLPLRNYAGQQVAASYKYLLDFETGVRYQMWHALAMGLTGLLLQRAPSRVLSLAAWCFLLGIVFFSGALYVLVIGGPKFGGIPWGAVAPIGGSLQLAGWLALLAGVLGGPVQAAPAAAD